MFVVNFRVRAALALAAGAVLLTGVVGLATQDTARSAARAAAPAVAAPQDTLAASITRLQQHITEVPGDYRALAQLGSAYVEQARVSVDPTYYPKAEAALRRSLTLRPRDNAEAMVGMGALAAARHDFTAARGWALRAEATNRYDAYAYGVLADAETQLGNATAATAAVQAMLDLRPGVAAFARASYDLEQRGRVSEAEAAMRRALDSASDPADIAFCRYHLGELAWHSGRLDEAARQYEAGAAASPRYAPLLEGRAKVAAARGQTDRALALYADLTAQVPDPTYLLEYGELLQASGHNAEARQQFSLFEATQRLIRANGGSDRLTTAQYATAHGDKAQGLRDAQAEWAKRHHPLVADALAWALHANGRDAEALPYMRQALRFGWRNAEFTYHLGMIELSLGQRDAARRDLTTALSTNPYFSPIHAPLARQALARIGGAR